MNMLRLLAVSSVVSLTLLAACSSGGPADVARDPHTPLKADKAALVVNGLGCPQCASQVDVQLVRLKGVTHANVDLSTGVVTISMSGDKRPSPHQLKEAVLDAGFTLVRVQELK